MRSVRTSMGATALLWACVLGCGGVGSDAEPNTTAGSGADSTTTGTTGGTTFAEPTTCASSEECDGGFCVAPYDAAAPTPSGGMGEAVCVASCVPELALDRWCLDDAACCGAAQCGPSDGLCIAVGGSTDGTAGETWATLDTGGSSDSTGAEGSSTGSGTSTSTSTDSSTGTGTDETG